MLRDAAVDLLMQRLGNNQETALRDLIITEMAAQQYELENGSFQPWFLLSEDATENTVANDARVRIPPAFITEYEEGALWYAPAGEKRTLLIKEDWDTIKNYYGTETGSPKHYALVGENFVFGPTPDAAYPLIMKYYKHVDAPSGTYGDETLNLETPWLKHAPELLISVTGAYIAGTYTRDADLEARMKDNAVRAARNLQARHIERQEVNRERQMGE